ncbi:uncharacterized protein LOC124456271 [Xenia sp. Carnegie-2017]|uniref:uncharacterized protein LOC124456271 n=1 Tax=Xenia sp. Carnegie-2017 TaxID=2897299 RepID=UPI001F03EE05|nr:uncharacterized protein LOC124456271 [Xenia sp. Carnegie-2017]
MVYCFAPTCGHSSQGNTCKFFAFPSATKQNDEYKRWIRLIRQFESCRIVIDCTYSEVAAPGLMSQQNATYLSYRGMNSFKRKSRPPVHLGNKNSLKHNLDIWHSPSLYKPFVSFLRVLLLVKHSAGKLMLQCDLT